MPKNQSNRPAPKRVINKPDASNDADAIDSNEKAFRLVRSFMIFFHVVTHIPAYY
jgi:hypothetical protein